MSVGDARSPSHKKNGEVRLCGGYKVTLNPYLIVNKHPLPRIDHLIAGLQGGKVFSKIDLKEAYAQVPVSAESKKYLTISTHKGLSDPNKLPYGIASAPGFYQKQMEQILSGIPNVYVFLDDIVIKGVSDEDNLSTTGRVFEVLNECGLKLRKG